MAGSGWREELETAVTVRRQEFFAPGGGIFPAGGRLGEIGILKERNADLSVGKRVHGGRIGGV